MTQMISRLLTATVLSGCVGLTLPAAAADSTTTNIDIGAGTPFHLTIPALDVMGSNISAEDLRTALTSGDLAKLNEVLSTLDASRIAIPELRLVTTATGADGATERSETVYRGFELVDVRDGVAASTVLASGEMTAPADVRLTFGKMSTGTFDISGLVGFYTTATGPADAEKKIVYENFLFEGAKLTVPDGTCDIGKASMGSFRARPLQTSFLTLIEAANAMNAGGEPSPAQIGSFVAFYVDLFDAFESTPMTFDGFKCDLKDDEARPMQISVGKMQIEGFSGSRYPAIEVDDFNISVEGDGFIRARNFTFKGMDLQGVIDTLNGAGGAFDEAWLEANYRKLVPALEGLSIEGLEMDVPDQEKPGQRIVAAIGESDVTLGAWINGVPTDLSFTGSDVSFTVPDDENGAMLRALGYTDLEFGYSMKARWDEAANAIEVSDLTVNADSIGTVSLQGTVGNATNVLFGDDLQAAQGAAMMLTVKSVSLDVEDAGLAPKLFEMFAAQQGKRAEDFRTEVANMAAGGAMMVLKGSEQAQQLSNALATFLNGGSKLSVSIEAKDPNGLGMMDFMAAQSDPSVLAEKVTIEAAN